MTTSSPTTSPAAAAATTYFDAWQDSDFDRLAEVLAGDVHFVGPMAEVRGADDALGGLSGLRQAFTALHVVRRLAEGDDAMTWFELELADGQRLPVVNWSHTGADGRIDRIRVTFDPRPLLG